MDTQKIQGRGGETTCPYIHIYIYISHKHASMGVPEVTGPFGGVPRTRLVLFLGLYWGPPFMETTM